MEITETGDQDTEKVQVQLPNHQPPPQDCISDEGVSKYFQIFSSELNRWICNPPACCRGRWWDSYLRGVRFGGGELGKSSGPSVAEQTTQPKERKGIQPAHGEQTSILLHLLTLSHLPAGNDHLSRSTAHLITVSLHSVILLVFQSSTSQEYSFERMQNKEILTTKQFSESRKHENSPQATCLKTLEISTTQWFPRN